MELITITEASRRYGLSGRWLRLLITEGRIKAQRFGNMHAIDSKEVELYVQNRRSRGRPAKKVRA
jgi:excisionase family DNA binding protein